MNKGNVLTQDITVKRSGTSDLIFNQTYTYDELNRLKSATETNNSTQTWKQTFTFDRYGNRRFVEANTTMPTSFSNQALTNPTISTSNNRLTSTGWTHDSAGNTTGDPDGRSFIYDAENKQIEVKNSSNSSIGTYFFDGDGKRVKKVVPSTGETTIFVYDASAKLIGEYSTIVQSSTNAKVQYLTQDNLGTPRINTDVTGAVTARHDYHPFGEEIATSQRTSGISYMDDNVRQQFTGYERDGESDLDFAQARYFDSFFGRFSSPDPLQASANSVRPQSWNRYTYSYNNPLRFADPTGMVPGDYVDEDGKKIGSDGVNDSKLYFVADEKDQDTVRRNSKNLTTTAHSHIASELELLDAAIRKSIGVDAVNEAKKLGGMQETGGQVVETASGQLAVPAKPGPIGTPGLNGGASINTRDAADPTLIAKATSTIPLTDYHVHPAGTKEVASLVGGKPSVIIKGFEQSPSTIDKTNAQSSSRATQLGYSLVVAAGSKMVGTNIDNQRPNGGQRVYFYDGTGTLGSMSLKGFLNAGR